MTETLYLRLSLPDASAPVERYALARDGSVTVACGISTLEEVTTLASERRLVVLIPGGEALSTTAHLPKMPAARIRASLPYALEEQLADDLEAQHFAIGKSSPTPKSTTESGIDVPVTVMQRERLEAWLSMLRSAGLEPDSLLLEDDCIAAKPGDVILWLRAGEAFIRTPTGEGLVTRAEDLGTALALLPADPPPAALGLQIFASPNERETHQLTVEQAATAFSRMVWIDAAQLALPWLVAQLPLAQPVELLQAQFAPRRRRSGDTRKWRLAAALAGLLLLAHVADRVLLWRAAASTEAALDKQIMQILRATRPELQSANDALRLLVDEGGRHGNRSGTGLALSALADIAAIGVPAAALRSVTLDGRALQIEFADSNASSVVASGLNRAGWQIQPGTTADGQANVTITRPVGGDR